jgi:hypothetical protein
MERSKNITIYLIDEALILIFKILKSDDFKATPHHFYHHGSATL